MRKLPRIVLILSMVAGSRRDIIRHAAHLIPLEQPDAFNKTVAEFLAGVEK